jgi:hypothetical protein
VAEHRDEWDHPAHIAIPPLVPEDFACEACGFSYAGTPIPAAVDIIGAAPVAARTLVAAVSDDVLRRRPASGGWSILEYLCHLRDVYITYTIRLHRARTEDRPVVEPMLNDLRARRFRYNESTVAGVLEELASTAAGCREEIARIGPADWGRSVTRLPGEHRTTRWLVRQAAHESAHHLRDMQRLAEGS